MKNIHEPKAQLHWANSIVITSKTIDWSEITKTASSKGRIKSWILQEYLSPPPTVPKVGTRRIPVIAVEKYGTGEKEETAFVDMLSMNQLVFLELTDQSTCVWSVLVGGKNVQLDSQSAVKSIVARASCFLQDRNTLEINLQCCISIPGYVQLFCGRWNL